MQWDRVQLWRIDTPLPTKRLVDLRRTLSPDELIRSEKLSHHNQRERFIARRGLLRQVLSNLLQIAPSQVVITYGQSGKPELSSLDHSVNQSPTTAIHFNMTHCRDVALIGVSIGQPIGIDLEAIDHNRNTQGLATRYFHPQEQTHLNSLPPSDRIRGFFDYWTSKEAVVKAHGGGIVTGLQHCLIHPSSDQHHLQTCELSCANQPFPNIHRWSIRTLELTDVSSQLYCAAIALPDIAWTLNERILQVQ